MELPTREACFFTVVPAAKSGIFASVVLGVGRAIGETMAVMMVAGNQTVIPEKITDGVRTLTTNIVMEMGYSTDLHREAPHRHSGSPVRVHTHHKPFLLVAEKEE